MFYTKGGLQGDSGFLNLKRHSTQSPFGSPFNIEIFISDTCFAIKGGRARTTSRFKQRVIFCLTTNEQYKIQ
jgi:hypothetical protein